MRGWWRMPQAMLSRRRMPPENCFTGSRARSARPVRSSAQSTCFASAAPASPCSRPNAVEILARGQQRIDGELLRHDAELLRRASRSHRLIEHANLAAVEPHPAGDRADQRRLAGAIRTEQRQQLALAQLERGAVRAPARLRNASGRRTRSGCSSWLCSTIASLARRSVPANGGARAAGGLAQAPNPNQLPKPKSQLKSQIPNPH